jgi:hypothetical protein
MATMRNLDIDQDFPVAGQDNESQGFRDNFNAIKESLTFVNEKVFGTGGLDETAVKLGERNQFDINASLETVKLLAPSETTVKSGQAIVLPSGQELNYQTGSYHSVLLTSSTNLDITGFPMPDGTEDGRYAKMRLDASLSTYSTTTAGSFIAGRVYTIFALGNTDFTAIGATKNIVGTIFKATGVGSGTGTAKEARTLSFTNTTAGGTIKYEGNWPTTLYVTSETNPVAVEFWSYDGGEIVYAQYLGQFGQTVRDTALVNLTVTGDATLGDAVTDTVVFKGIPKLPLVDGVTLSGLTPEVGMMIFNTTTKRVQSYVPDTGLAQGNNASGTPGWVNIS